MHAHPIAEDAGEIKAPKRKPHNTDPWYKRYPRDFYEDTRDLKPDERGLYNDLLDLIYMAGGPLADDDRLLSYKMHVHIGVWRRVRKRLLATGKLFLNRGQIMNKRAKEVLATRDTERAAMGYRGGDSLPSQGELFKNSNDFNGGLRASSTELESQKEEVEEEGDNIIPLRASQRLAGLNGAADPMLKDVIGWMAGGDEQCAREWLGKQVAIYGETAVRDSYSKLSTDMASGSKRLIARPLQTWCSIAARLHGAGQAGQQYASGSRSAKAQANAAFTEMLKKRGA